MEKIQTFLRSILKSSKKTMGMVIILLVAVAVPITLGLIKQNQDNRQEAASNLPAQPYINTLRNDTGHDIVAGSNENVKYYVKTTNSSRILAYVHGKSTPTASDAVVGNYDYSQVSEDSNANKFFSLPVANTSENTFMFRTPNKAGDYYFVVNIENAYTGDDGKTAYYGCSWDKRAYVRDSNNSVTFLSGSGGCSNSSASKFTVKSGSTAGNSITLNSNVYPTGNAQCGKVQFSWNSVSNAGSYLVVYSYDSWKESGVQNLQGVTGTSTIGDFTLGKKVYAKVNVLNKGIPPSIISSSDVVSFTMPSSCNTTGESGGTVPTVNSFNPVINGSNITFTVSGNAKNYWVYVMRASTAPDKSKSTQYTTLQNYDASLPQENTFYRAQVSSNGSVSFAKPTREGPYWIVVNGHSESVQVPGSLTDSVCAWDGKLYKYTASGGVESTGSCSNVGVKGVASDTSSENPGDGGTGGNTGGNTGTTNPTGGVFPTRPQGPSLWDKIRCQNSCRNSRARDLEKLCIDKCLADVGNNGNPGGATGGQNMNLALTVSLPGIGSGQDASTSGTTGNNMNPKRTTRQGQMQIFNMNNEQVKSSAVSFTYSASGSAQQTGVYTSTVNIDGISPGTYYIKLSMDNTLFTQVSGVITLKEGNNTVPRVTLIPGDLNQDNNLNMSDHSIFVGCYGKKECPADEKTRSDFNDDGVIDGKDYNILIRAFAIRAGA